MREKPTEQFLLDKQQNIWREKPSLGQDLVQLRANLEVLVRFCNTHRLDNGSGYKVWYKENGLEIPAKPPTVKDRFYDFLNINCQEA